MKAKTNNYMVLIKNKAKLICLVLISLILFQSCRVYHKENVSLDKAVTEGKRVKIITKKGLKLKFKKIVIDNNEFYGIEKVKGKLERTPLDSSTIESLRLHNKTMSIIYGTGIGFVISGVVLMVIFIATWDGPDFDFSPIQLPN